MTMFVGRQPILDKFQRTYGYELLFRDGTENAFGAMDADDATLSVIDTSIGHMGLEAVTGHKKAFINFTRRLLLEDFGNLLPKEHAVIEILEDIEPDQEVVEACRRLKEDGYVMALDDFVYDTKYDPLIELVDIIKVDLSVSDAVAQEVMAKKFLPMNIRMLAERVETQDDFEQTKQMGYGYFQGYFFSKPVVLSAEQVPQSKLARIQLLQLINQPDFDLDRAETIIKHDPSLTMKLLRYINSVIFGLPLKVGSIRQALTLLGERNIRKWSTVLILSGLIEDKPVELLRQAIIRGRFCELMAGPAGLARQDQELFMTGLFSLLDTMMSRPMEKLLADIPLAPEIKSTLLGEPSPYHDVLGLAMAFENSDWEDISKKAAKLDLEEDVLADFQQESFGWADEIAPA